MGALTPEQPRIIAGRNTEFRVCVIGTILVLLISGCRSLGISTGKVGTASLHGGATSLPNRSTPVSIVARPKNLSSTKQRSVSSAVNRASTAPKSVDADEFVEDEHDSDNGADQVSAERAHETRGVSQNRVDTVSHPHYSDNEDSFIEIFRIVQTTPSETTEAKNFNRRPRQSPRDANDQGADDAPILHRSRDAREPAVPGGQGPRKGNGESRELTDSEKANAQRANDEPILNPSRDAREPAVPALRLTFPSEIPGANAPHISLPVTDENNPGPKLAVIDALFPPPPASKVINPPTDRILTLEELEDMALLNSPILAQSLAAITMNQGTTIQQGIYPNPVFGYESDTVGSSFTRDYQGVYVSQLVKTGGKLTLQRAAANMDLMNSKLAYDRTRLEILRMTRAGYYNVLVAQEAMRINEALNRFSNQVYTIMINRLKNGEQAPYELSQLQSLVIQARWTLNSSQNRYLSAWKQLAAATGVTDLAPATLEGRVDMTVPNLNFDVLLDRALVVHPDMQASRNLAAQSRIQVKLQKTIPIPDFTVAGAFQNDSTTPGYQRTSYNLNVSVPVPIYDRNQGNILKEQGRLKMNVEQLAVTTNQLTTQLADAFERYQTARVQAEYARTQVLPDLARAYRGYYEAHINTPETVEFSNIILAQQNLAAGVSVYISALLNQWLAMTDIANLVQARDFREMFTSFAIDTGAPVPDVPSPAPREGGQP